MEYEFLRIVKSITHKRPAFRAPHGPMLRAGNSTSDIGKPGIDIARLSERPVMVLNSHLVVNDAERLRKHLRETMSAEEGSLTADQLIECLQVKLGNP